MARFQMVPKWDLEAKMKKKVAPSPAKAREILRHGEVKGHPLTEPQKDYFGSRAGGAPVKKGKKRAG